MFLAGCAVFCGSRNLFSAPFFFGVRCFGANFCGGMLLGVVGGGAVWSTAHGAEENADFAEVFAAAGGWWQMVWLYFRRNSGQRLIHAG